MNTAPEPATDVATVKSKDLYFAAFLKTAGMPFVEATRLKDEQTGQHHTFFVFERLDTYPALKRDYFAGKAVALSPQAFANEIKTCKYLCHNPD